MGQLVKDSTNGRGINTAKFRENTILRRLKGLKIVDPERDIDKKKKVTKTNIERI